VNGGFIGTFTDISIYQCFSFPRAFWGFFWELFFERFAPLRSGSCWTLGRNHSRAFRVGSKGFSESWFSTFHPQASIYTRLFFWELIGFFSRSCSHWSIEHPFFNGLGMNWTCLSAAFKLAGSLTNTNWFFEVSDRLRYLGEHIVHVIDLNLILQQIPNYLPKAMEILVIFLRAFSFCSRSSSADSLLGIWIGHLSNNSLSASFSTAFLLFLFFFSRLLTAFLLARKKFLICMWFCCYSFGSQLAWKNFDCSSLSQWQIPSRLLDRASSFSSFSHSLILPKMLFNTLSLPQLLRLLFCFDDGSRGISNPAPSSTGSIAGKFATFSLNFALNPLLCSAVQPSQHTSVLHPIKSNQFHSKLVTWTQRLFLQSQFWRPEHQHTWLTAARLDSSCAFPAFQIVIADFHLSIVW